MFWDVRDIMLLCIEFVLFVLQDGVNICFFCCCFGILFVIGYKWFQCWVQEGVVGFQDCLCILYYFLNCLFDDIMVLLCMVYDCYECWGVCKIKCWFEDQGYIMFVFSIVYNLMVCYGLLLGVLLGIFVMGWFEYDVLNCFWQMDFKGYFFFGGGCCYSFILLDDYFCFFLCLVYCIDEWCEIVQQQLVSVFECYGLLDWMIMDNGLLWGDIIGIWMVLELWLMCLGIWVGYFWFYYLQMQGKLECFYCSLKVEVLQGKWFVDSGELQCVFDYWWMVYNFECLYEVLDMVVLGLWYQLLVWQYSGNIMFLEYDEGVMVRKVDISGKLSVKGVSLSVGKVFRGEWVGLKEMQEDGSYEVWWYSMKVGVIDLKKKLIIMGKGC